jgi:hypothetical protein
LGKGLTQLETKKFNGKREILSALAITFISFIIGLWAFRESPAQLPFNKIPLGGDGLSTGLYIRLILEGSWGDILTQHIYSNQFGWPGNLDYTNYPSGNLIEIIAIKFFSILTGILDPSSLIHIFAIAKIIPITLTSYIFLRLLNQSNILCFFGAIAFSTSTFNLIRAEGHFFLGFTWPVPVTLALLYFAFKISHDEISSGQLGKIFWNRTLKFIVPSFIVGLSSFYFAIISLILGLFFVLLILFSYIANTFSLFTFSKFSYKVFFILFNKVSGFILILAGVSLGLIAQIAPIFLRTQNLPALSGIADRSWTESIVFSGSLESFYFDATALFLKMVGRPEILNFTSTRISWEGSQVGALAGIVAAMFILFLFFQLARNNWPPSRENLNPSTPHFFTDLRLRFLGILSFFCLLLYLPNPFNFGISQIFPQIRAWGRVSVFLTLCMIGILIVSVELVKKNSITGFILILSLCFLPFFETLEFRKSRPAANDVSRFAEDALKSQDATLLNIKKLLNKDCPIFQIPIYPYPEFDVPDDSVGDYAGISLPSRDYGYFRWSSPAIKDTYAWKALQPLVSQSPNFVRVKIGFGIEYGKSLKACAALIDRAQLTSLESIELEDLMDNSSCFNDLDGEIFSGASRFVLHEYTKECPINVRNEALDFAKSNLNGEYLWKIDQAYGVGFNNEFQMFPVNSAINMKLIAGKNQAKSSKLRWKIFFEVKDAEQSILNKTEICKENKVTLKKSCAFYAIDPNGFSVLIPELGEISNGLNRFEFTLPQIVYEQSALINWGLVLSQN